MMPINKELRRNLEEPTELHKNSGGAQLLSPAPNLLEHSKMSTLPQLQSCLFPTSLPTLMFTKNGCKNNGQRKLWRAKEIHQR